MGSSSITISTLIFKSVCEGRNWETNKHTEANYNVSLRFILTTIIFSLIDHFDSGFKQLAFSNVNISI